MKHFLFLLPTIGIILSGCETNKDKADTSRNASYSSSFPETSESDSDRAITQNVRQSLVNDDSLSTNAKNVRVTTNRAIVTLRGQVNNEREKSIIEQRARSINGVRSVDNQLETTGSFSTSDRNR